MPVLLPVIASQVQAPLVAVERLRPPSNMSVEPIDMPSGTVWRALNEIEVGGAVRPMPKFQRGGYPVDPETDNGFLVWHSEPAMWTWRPLAKSPTRYHALWNGYRHPSIDERGHPVGFLNWAVGAPVRPMRGRVALLVPKGTVGGGNDERLYASPHGTYVAGTLSFASKADTKLATSMRAYLWSNDRKAPRALPLIPGCASSSASGVNSSGDVIGLQWGGGVDPKAVVWRRKGPVETLALAYPDRFAKREGEDSRYWWLPGSPELITDDGLIIGTEGTVVGGNTLRTLVLGDRAIWLPEAIEGVSPAPIYMVRRSGDGRGLLLSEPGSTSQWIRVRRR